MIVKIFPNKGGGSAKASIDYLRGKNQDREKAVVLKGDPDLSQSIAESLEFKNNYTVGCLSFEEPNLPKKEKEEIIDRFEKTFFAGMEEDQYNITWIEHTDKNRLELNFFIPNVELKTEKRLQPYFDKADRPLADNFKKVINHDYQLTNPDAPDKAQLLKSDSKSPKAIKEYREGITDLVSQHVAKGTIKNQEQIVEQLEQSGFEISRVTKKSISIKNPEGGRNIRLDGELYSKEFYEKTGTIEKFRENFESGTGRSKQISEGTDTGNIEQYREQLERAIENRSNRNQELYFKQNTLDNGHDRSSNDLDLSNDNQHIIRSEESRADQRFREGGSEISRIQRLYEASGRGADDQGRDFVRNQQVEKLGNNEIDTGLQRPKDMGLERESDNEFRRTITAIIERARSNYEKARERITTIFGFVREAENRNQKYNSIGSELKNSNEQLTDSHSEFRERKQEFDSREREFNDRKQKIESSIDDTGRREQQRSELSVEVARTEQEIEITDREIEKMDQYLENRQHEVKVVEQEDEWELEM